MTPITVSEIGHRPHQFSGYIDEVPPGDLHQRLNESAAFEGQLDLQHFQALASSTYASGKWTVSDVLQHISDTERIFSYRALRFARGDQTRLPGFDENLFARTAAANARPFEQILAELRLVRASTIAMFAGFSRQELLSKGVCSDIEITVASLGFAIIGHHRHHVRVLNERYAGL